MAMDINIEKKPEAGGVNAIEKPKAKVKSSGSGFKAVVAVVVILAVLLVAVFLVDKYTSVSLFGKSTGGSYNDNGYQAVFLSNGQVYFGKVAKKTDTDTVLADIYYLQVSNPLQQAPNQQTAGQPELSLVKLGNELHGPEDRMVINNDHVLFTEDLKEDGKVVQAIVNYQESNE